MTSSQESSFDPLVAMITDGMNDYLEEWREEDRMDEAPYGAAEIRSVESNLRTFLRETSADTVTAENADAIARAAAAKLRELNSSCGEQLIESMERDMILDIFLTTLRDKGAKPDPNDQELFPV